MDAPSTYRSKRQSWRRYGLAAYSANGIRVRRYATDDCTSASQAVPATLDCRTCACMICAARCARTWPNLEHRKSEAKHVLELARHVGLTSLRFSSLRHRRRASEETSVSAANTTSTKQSSTTTVADRQETLASLRIGETTLYWLQRTKRLNPIDIGRVLSTRLKSAHRWASVQPGRADQGIARTPTSFRRRGGPRRTQ